MQHPVIKTGFALLALIPTVRALSDEPSAAPVTTNAPPQVVYVPITPPTTTMHVWLVNTDTPPEPMSATDVILVQQALNALGYPCGIDGVYGPKTEEAVRQFQQDHRLFVDGIVGPVTTRALGLEGILGRNP